MSTVLSEAVPGQIRARLSSLGIQPGQVVRATGKSITFHAQMDAAAVVVKVLLTDDPMWVRHQQAEQAAYRTTEADACPLTTARMRFGDGQITILDRLPGQVLHPDRYPRQLPEPVVRRILEHLDLIYTWRPDGLTRQPVTSTYLDRHTASGLLTSADRAAVDALLADGQPLRVEHGDPHSTNFLITGDSVAVVDLEHMGWHLAGLDWAMLRLLWGPANPWLPTELQCSAERDGVSGAYAVNLMLLACREWQIHLAEPDFAQLQPVLEANLTKARDHLHRTHRSMQ
ncbi:phosphotransferase [Catellatospora sp. NPDC049111]|uniref:phosphotransferase n=1 Tax=Catellatospora sp. NPDC049111 TaxID=3155271 RepID=UPI0033E360B1